MARLILILAIIAVIFILYQRSTSVPHHKRRADYIKMGLGIAVFAVVVLTLAGKMHWIGIAATGLLVALRQLLPTLVRLFPMLSSLRSQAGGGPSPGQTSTVETPILRTQLAHDSGDLHGEVLQGSYLCWLLSELNREQLRELMDYFSG